MNNRDKVKTMNFIMKELVPDDKSASIQKMAVITKLADELGVIYNEKTRSFNARRNRVKKISVAG